MKKIISLLLAILMLCSMLAGCKKKASISDAALAAKEELEADDAEPGSIGDYDPGEVESEAPAIDTDLGDISIGEYKPGEIEADAPAVDVDLGDTGIGEYKPGEIDAELPSFDFDLDFGSIGEYNPGEIEAIDPTESLIDFEFDIPSFSYNPPAIESIAPDLDISFEIPSFTYEVPPIEASAPSIMEFEFSDDISYVKGLEDAGITPGEFTFAIPDMEYELDIETFDPEEFIFSSMEGLSTKELETLEGIPEMELIRLAEYKASLLADLSIAFQTSGLSVTVDSTTGEIMIDSAILFGYNEDSVSDLGKAMLDRFLLVYTSVIFSEKYEGFISEILVEGHTDTSGDYNYNLNLSQRRADNVSSYCTGSSAISDDARTALGQLLTPVGRSYDLPVYDANGNVDMDASRRVSFRFLINPEF
ncbi:MAG: OmpA family protein [Oscillospiraceae bacterium]|nr:OmpA family protein [Oscillospiraceae bacterium]